MIVRFAALAILLAACAPALSADRIAPVTKHAGFTWFGGYDPITPRSLQDIPEPARSRIVAHLRDRLGDFYARLAFDGGQVINRAELARVNPDSRNYRWEVPAYVLHFRFSEPGAGIAAYVARIEARSDGSIIEDIDLPRFRAAPGKQRFAPLDLALDVAKVEGYDPDKLKVELVYDADSDSIAWQFSQVTGDDGTVIDYKRLTVSAHTAEVIRRDVSEAIR